MSYNSVPHSISLILILSKLFDEESAVLVKRSEAFQSFREIFETEEVFNHNDAFTSNPSYVGHLQLLMLTALSMYGGVLVPVIQQFSYDEGRFRIVWDSGSVDQFTFKQWDEDFLKFASYYVDRLSSKPRRSTEIQTSVVSGVLNYLKSYMVILRACKKRVELLMKSKGDILFFLKENSDKDLFFILLSSLPSQQMNALFIYVQQFFPKDLDVTTGDGMKVNVCATFETPSTDVRFLIEKTKIYIDLYYNKKYPIIREITVSKTLEFMKKILNNDEVYQETTRNLKTLKQAQIDMRITLYDLLISHLKEMHHEKASVS